MSVPTQSSSAPAVTLTWPKLRAFARRYGKPQVKLSLYAALPIRLTPELLNLIRVNFVPEAHFITEADVLLSDLVYDRGGGYYEFPPEMRETLLRELRDTLGEKQLLRVADFLYRYCEYKMCEELTELERGFLRAQKWTALSYLNPEEAAVCLAGQLNNELQNRDGDRTRQIIGLIRTLEAPLRGAHGVARYAAGLDLVLDNKGEAAKVVYGTSGMDEACRVGKVNLPSPAVIARMVEGGQIATAEIDVIEAHEQDRPKAHEQDRPAFTGFDMHVYISYAHVDNQPLVPDQQGWITRFHATLEALLSMRLGDKARIWRDTKLQGNDIFADEIADQLAQTAVLVSVLTPRYLNSEWCIKELSEFCKIAEQSGGVVVENKARVFKVLKTPVDTQESLPSVVKDVLGYEFFTFEDEMPLELDPAYGEKYAQDYNRRIGKLAWDISQLLKTLEAYSSVREQGHDEQTTVIPTIYLAECSYDRKEAREILERDLRQHGYTVLPDRQLPRDEADYVAAVEDMLERCRLAIHLVGESYGAVPEGPSQKSVTVLQNELAVQRSKIGALPRVIWLPEGTDSEQARQQAFIEALQRDAEAQFGADLITTDLETLKTVIHDMLKQLEKPEREQPEEQAAAVNSAKLIYLICDQKDRKATAPVRKFCRNQGFEVALPAFEGDATAVRKAHQQLLATCDAVILFYGAGDEAWKRTVDNELKKMPGYRGGKPLLASYTYLADPKTNDKEDLIDMEEPNLIDGLEGFSEPIMEAFMQAINLKGVIS